MADVTVTTVRPARDAVNREQGRFALSFESANNNGTYVQHLTIPELVQAGKAISDFLADCCTCSLGSQCGPDGCECTTTVMECPVHSNSDTGRMERHTAEHAVMPFAQYVEQMQNGARMLAEVHSKLPPHEHVEDSCIFRAGGTGG